MKIWFGWGVCIVMLIYGCPQAEHPRPVVAPKTPPRQAPPAPVSQVSQGQAMAESPSKYVVAIDHIAQDIAGLKDEYPQLTKFSASRDVDREQLKISYGYHTHQPRHRGGWTSGVPNPDDDGIWFYIDFHDPSSMAQIHTQPVVPDLRFGNKKVMVLMLEGKRTRRLGPAIDQILKKHGVRPGP